MIEILNNRQTKTLFILFSFALLFTACKPDKQDPSTTAFKAPGMFICNEGPFQTGTGSVDYYSLVGHEIQKDIFFNRNAVPLGNIAQSMFRIGDTIYIIVNNSNKIQVVKAADFSLIGSIEGLTLPRYMLAVSGNKAYVSCWDNSIAVIDLATRQVKGHIPVGTGPEKMLLFGSKVLVLNQGGFSVDSTVSVINTLTDAVVQTLDVFPRPTGIVRDGLTGAIWVMCSGKGFNGWPSADDSEGHLLKLQTGATFSIYSDFVFADKTSHPEKLIENVWGYELLYLYKNGIYKQEVTSNHLDTASFVNIGIPFYGFGYFDRGSLANSFVVASDPVDYTQNGWVYMFSAADGHLVDSVKSGVIPTDFLFLK